MSSWRCCPRCGSNAVIERTSGCLVISGNDVRIWNGNFWWIYERSS